MPNPFAPILGFLGIAAAGGGSKKRRRRKNKSKTTNGDSTQRSGNRALDIIRIQRGLPREDPSSETDDDVAAQPNGASRAPSRAPVGARRRRRRGRPRAAPDGEVRVSDGVQVSDDVHVPDGEVHTPEGVPQLRISKVIGSDTIGITSDGSRGYVGAQWWSRHGRDLLVQIRRRHPAATPEETLGLLLKQAMPSVEWESEELPRGAHMLARRLRRMVEAAYMGREAEAPTLAEREAPQAAPDGVSDGEGQPDAQAPDPSQAFPPGMPRREVPPEAETSPEAPEGASETAETTSADAPASSEPEGGSEASGDAEVATPEPSKPTRRGGRGRGGKRERKAATAKAAKAAEDAASEQESAHDTPEGNGGGASDGSSDTGSDDDSADTDAPPSE